MIAGRKKTNYPYAVARVQAKRAKLIPDAEYDKVLKMDVSEITRYIQDSVYKAEVDELSPRFSGLDLLEAALTVNMERTHAKVRQFVDGEGGLLLSTWLDRYLVEAIKTVLRGKQGGATKEELLKELLLEDLDTYNIFQPLLADDVDSVQDVVAALAKQPGLGASWASVLQKVPSDASLSAYEDALDKAYYGRLIERLEASKQKGAGLVVDYARREIDARNLQNAARWVANKQTGDFSPYIIPGGRAVPVSAVVGLSQSSDLEQFRDRVAELGLPDSLHDALGDAVQKGRLAPFQAALTAWHMQQLEKLRAGAPLSIVPILLFLTRKRREVVNLRTIARGRAAGLDEERLRELMQ